MPTSTANAAQWCIDALSTCAYPRNSPLYTVMTTASALEFSRQAWVIRGHSRS